MSRCHAASVRTASGPEPHAQVNESERRPEQSVGSAPRTTVGSTSRLSPGSSPGDHERDPAADHHRVVGGAFVVAARRTRAAPPSGARPRRPRPRSRRRSRGTAPSGGRPSRRPCRAAPCATAASLSANASTARCVCTLACAPMRSMMPADPRRQLAGVQAAGRPGDVAHQPGRELDLVQDAQHREQLAEVGRHRLLEREQLVHPLLDLRGPARRSPRVSS